MKLSEVGRRLRLERLGEDVEVSAVVPVEDAGPGDLSFVVARKWLERAAAAGGVIVPQELSDDPALAGKPLLVSPRPSLDAARAADALGHRGFGISGIHPSAVVDGTAELGDGVAVGPQAVIGAGVVIGARTAIHAGAVIHDRCVIGADCIVYANTVIGSDGFGYEFVDGRHHKIAHFGIVRIEDEVEIGAATTVDRARFGETLIGAGTKIGSLVVIAHNVRIGRCCIVVSQVGISGSCRIGDGVFLGGQAGLGSHVTVGPGARVGGAAGVAADVPAGGRVSGVLAQRHRDNMAQMSAVRKLPEFMKTVQRFLESHRE